MIDDIPHDLRGWAHIGTVRSYFKYDPATGKIYKQSNGREVGYLHQGYIRVSINTLEFYAHQVAFAIMLGYVPEEVDHIDKNRANNSWSNLRPATRQKNARNSFKRKRNKSGFKGVHWSKSNKAWMMQIQVAYKKYFSYHSTPEDAHKVYCELSAKLHKEFGCND